MLSVLLSRRKALVPAAFAAMSIFLAACEPMASAGRGPAVDPSKPVQVALLLPSGSGAAGDEILARDLKQAADMAVADLASSVRIDLRVYNVGSDPAIASQMATQAVADGAAIILGPVYGETANAAGLAVRGQGVNVLSFSNNTDIAGGNVFVLGQTSQNSAARVVSYVAREGKRNLLVVHEQTPQGDLGRRAVEVAARQSGARIAAVVPFEFSAPGVTAAVPTIVSTARSSGADAMILTSDPAGALPLLAQVLPQAGLSGSQIQYAGLTRWDIPAETMRQPGLEGGIFAYPDQDTYGTFRSRYTAAYGSEPNLIAGLAYDGVAAIGALVKSGRADPFSAASLTQGAGFAGVNGVFRLRSDGTNERGMAVAQIRNGTLVIIDPAPRSFGGAGL